MAMLPSIIYRLPMWIVLAIMATADAFIFWYTLAGIMHQVALLWVFVLALSVGSVAACHYAGRLLRVGRNAGPVRLALVFAILSAWLALGLLMAWIRSHDELYRRPEEVGVVAADTAISSMASVFVAVLMLALYLLTGLLTIAHSLHYVDPVALRTQVRRLRRRRTRRLARLRHQAALADNLARQHAEDFKLEQEYFAAQNERHDAWTHLLAELARVRFAVHLGDPSATDGLFPPPGAPTTPLLVPDDGATPNGATPNGATPNGATPNGATPNGAPLTEVPPSASRPSPAALPLDPDRPTRTGLPT